MIQQCLGVSIRGSLSSSYREYIVGSKDTTTTTMEHHMETTMDNEMVFDMIPGLGFGDMAPIIFKELYGASFVIFVIRILWPRVYENMGFPKLGVPLLGGYLQYRSL